jgi:hypothetical protein
MGTGEKGKLVWATAHYTSHPLTFPDFLFLHTTFLYYILLYVLLAFLRSLFFPFFSPFFTVYVCSHFSSHVSHVLRSSRYVPTVLFRMLLRCQSSRCILFVTKSPFSQRQITYVTDSLCTSLAAALPVVLMATRI